MTQGQVMDLMQDALVVAFKLAAPMLIISIAVGLIISIFQAATQIHEQTLTFVPKVVVIALLLLFTGSWMMNLLGDFVRRVFTIMMTL